MNMMPSIAPVDAPEGVLFASEDLLVRRVPADPARPSDICYVTFDSYTDDRRLDRAGFGEGFLRSRGIDAVHVVSRDNHWYQYGELPDALGVIAAAVAGYSQVIAYGSSMGGYAALHYGRACGAQIGIALSPQYSVDPAVVPFEDRWAHDMARIRFRRDVTLPLATQYVVYDPCDRYDREHAALFAARSRSVLVPIPHAGHPVGSYLSETGMFAELFAGVHGGTLDAARFAAALRAERRSSGQYLFTLAHRVPPRRIAQKLGLARMAVAASPGEAIYLRQLGHVLDAAGRHEEARDTLARAAAISGRTIHALHDLLLHHERLGEIDAALAIADDLAAEHPGVFIVEQSRGRLRRKRRHARPGGWLVRLLHLDPLIERFLARRERTGPAG